MTKKAKNPLHSESFYIGKALEFANYDRLDTVSDAQNLLFTDFGVSVEVDSKDKPASGLSYIRNAQSQLRTLLSRIVKNPSLTPQLRKSINRQWLAKVRAVPQLEEQGRITFDYSFGGIVEAAMLGVALLFHTNQASRLRQCQLCKNFLLTVGQATRTKFCPNCADKNEKQQARRRRRRNYRKNWLLDNDLDAYAKVEAGKLTVEKAFEQSKNSRERK